MVEVSGVISKKAVVDLSFCLYLIRLILIKTSLLFISTSCLLQTNLCLYSYVHCIYGVAMYIRTLTLPL